MTDENMSNTMIADPVIKGSYLITKETLETVVPLTAKGIMSAYGVTEPIAWRSIVSSGLKTHNSEPLKCSYEELVSHYIKGDMTQSELYSLAGRDVRYLLSKMDIPRTDETRVIVTKLAQSRRDASRRELWTGINDMESFERFLDYRGVSYDTSWHEGITTIDLHRSNTRILITSDESHQQYHTDDAIVLNESELVDRKLDVLRYVLNEEHGTVINASDCDFSISDGELRIVYDDGTIWKAEVSDDGTVSDLLHVNCEYTVNGLIESIVDKIMSNGATTVSFNTTDGLTVRMLSSSDSLIPTASHDDIDGTWISVAERHSDVYGHDYLMRTVRTIGDWLDTVGVMYSVPDIEMDEMSALETSGLLIVATGMSSNESAKSVTADRHKVVSTYAKKHGLDIVFAEPVDMTDSRSWILRERLLSFAIKDANEANTQSDDFRVTAHDVNDDVFEFISRYGCYTSLIAPEDTLISVRKDDGTMVSVAGCYDNGRERHIRCLVSDTSLNEVGCIVAIRAIVESVDSSKYDKVVLDDVDFMKTGIVWTLNNGDWHGFDGSVFNGRKNYHFENPMDASDRLSINASYGTSFLNRSGIIYRKVGHRVNIADGNSLWVLSVLKHDNDDYVGWYPAFDSTSSRCEFHTGFVRNDDMTLAYDGESLQRNFDRAVELGVTFKMFIKMGNGDIESTLVHRMESDAGVLLQGSPDDILNLKWSQLLTMRDQMMSVNDMSEVTGLSRKSILNLITSYGLKMDSNATSVFLSNNLTKQIETFKAEHDGKLPIQVASKEELSRRAAKARATYKERTGKDFHNDPDIKRKAAETLRRNSGVTDDSIMNPFQLESVKEKARKTNLEKYGVEYYSQSDDAKKRRKEYVRVHGYEPGHSEESTARRHRTNMERYGYEEAWMSPEVQERLKNNQLESMGKSGISEFEEKVISALESIGLHEDTDYIRNCRSVIPPKEVDFWFPSRKIAIEVSPSFTHHSNMSAVGKMKPKPSTYHWNKKKECADVGVDLLTINDEMLSDAKWPITFDIIKMKLLGTADKVLYGRNTVVTLATSNAERMAVSSFIDRNHLSGYIGSKWLVSIKDSGNGTMVGAASFRDRNGELELTRCCWKIGVQVRFGLSKLVSFIASCSDFNDYDVLVSFSSNDIGDGLSYDKVGFDFKGNVPPKMSFVNPHDPSDRYSWQVAKLWGYTHNGVIAKDIRKRGLSNVIKTNMDARRYVETELTHRSDNGHGYFAVYDSGSKKWELDLNRMRK